MLDTSLDSFNFYFLLAVFQGFILSAIIIFRQPTRKPNLFFGLLVFLISLSLLHLILEQSIHAFNAVFPVPMDFGLAFGPLAYFHVLFIKDPMRRFRASDLLHFLPTFFLDGVLFSTTFIYLGNHLEWAYDNVPLIQGAGIVMAFLGSMQLTVYTYLIYKETKDAHPVLRDFDRVKKWLSYLIIAWSALVGFLVLALPVALIFVNDFDDNSGLVYQPMGILKGLCIYVLGYLYLLRYSSIVGNYTERISNFKFSVADLADRKRQLLEALKEDKVYEDPKLTVAKLAGHMGWPINNLSAMINESLHTNFNDLINQYRVEAFKARVLAPDSQKYSILGHGQEVGFSSKASLYRVFKKQTGTTPTDFIKSQG